MGRWRLNRDCGADCCAVCVLRGRDVQRIARQELGTDVSLTTVNRTLHRVGYEWLMPRPRHEEQDAVATHEKER